MTSVCHVICVLSCTEKELEAVKSFISFDILRPGDQQGANRHSFVHVKSYRQHAYPKGIHQFQETCTSNTDAILPLSVDHL